MNFITVVLAVSVLERGLGWAEVSTHVAQAVVEHGSRRSLHGRVRDKVLKALAWRHSVDCDMLTDEFWREKLGSLRHLVAIVRLVSRSRCEWLVLVHSVRRLEVLVIRGEVSVLLVVNVVVVEHLCCDSDKVGLSFMV